MKDTTMTNKTMSTTTINILKALGNKHRLAIVQLLLTGEKNVSEINVTIKVSQPALSQHLSKLKRASILSARRNQRQIYYSIKDVRVLRLIGMFDEQGKAAA